MKSRKATSSSSARSNLFVGMVNVSGNRVNGLDSVSETTAIIESDGEGSVGTSQVGIVAEEKEPKILPKSVQS